MPTGPVLVWLRRDLRLTDNPALAAAARTGAPVVPVFVLDDDAERPPGAASRWWLHESLAAFDRALRRCRSRLVLRRGRAVEAIARLAAETGAGEVVWNRRADPHGVAADRAAAEALAARGVAHREHDAALLAAPGAVATADGAPYRVFAPFWKALHARPIPRPEPAPARLAAPDSWPESDALASWRLQPPAGRAEELAASWTPGEEGALARLDALVERGIDGYCRARDLPAEAGTSRLSPHLHFGEIGPRQVWHALAAREADAAEDVAAFRRQLAWRDFCHGLLLQRPDMVGRPFRAEFAAFPWRPDEAALEAWRGGRTGYPFVDAGMRELRATGWMHNRARMVAASFLTKHLLQPWTEGEAWFWDTLVDADLANNVVNWQWVAGCGADAAPYFRIFNPVLQGRRFDPDGRYVRRWLPELSGLPDECLHEPWRASEAALAAARVRLGKTYPAPLVEHSAARARALAAFAAIRSR